MLNRVHKIDDRVRLKRGLISVSDKTGLEAFVQELWRLVPDFVVYSTGGTYDKLKTIAPAGRLIPVSDYTGQPEMQGGLVKTLDFKLYLGLLSETYNEAHRQDLERNQAVPIDLVVVNLYPFEATVAKPDATLEDARSNIDIGGPCMLRASAKNFLRVAAVCDPADYGRVLEKLQQGHGFLNADFRLQLAKKAFKHTAHYDAQISAWLGQETTVLSQLYDYQDKENSRS
jgi:phosphoribosylaminoimidazolecarboxamide formyltransferase/IMP cyclohydrolase